MPRSDNRESLTAEERADPFAAARFEEGRRWRTVLKAFTPAPALVLDVGAGNRAIELAFKSGGYRVVSVETGWNETARKLDVRRVLADATALPFRDGVFGAVLMLETIEHLVRPADAAAEAARVMTPGGSVLITTLARWRFAFRGDPHFGIPFLTLLPPRIQRRVVASRGFDAPHHFVDRIYSSTAEIAKVIAPLRIKQVLSRSRLPQRWFWDAIVAAR